MVTTFLISAQSLLSGYKSRVPSRKQWSNSILTLGVGAQRRAPNHGAKRAATKTKQRHAHRPQFVQAELSSHAFKNPTPFLMSNTWLI